MLIVRPILLFMEAGITNDSGVLIANLSDSVQSLSSIHETDSKDVEARGNNFFEKMSLKMKTLLKDDALNTYRKHVEKLLEHSDL
ncbi:hypothetical protein Plhal703r1_c13g0067131 [Plasmopara halstedii]